MYENWTINKNGNFIYLFYEEKNAIDDTLYVLLEKNYNRRDTEYYELDHYYLVPDTSKNFAVNKYIFTKPGNYKISVFNRKGISIAPPHYTTIDYYESEYDFLSNADSWYYSNSVLTFYEKKVNDSLFGENKIFTLKEDGIDVVLSIVQKNKKPIKSNNLLVTIYTDDKNKVKINSIPYYVDYNWNWTTIRVPFKQKGKFIVEVYNDSDVFINSSKIEIQ